MNLRWLSESGGALEGKRVLLRVDLDAIASTDPQAADRLTRAAVPTIEWLRQRGARTLLLTQRGQPRGRSDSRLTLAPVAERLRDLLGEIVFTDDCIGDGVRRLASDLRPGQVLLLENVGFHPGEERDDEVFARQLAAHADCYVGDAFASAHQLRASNHAVARLFDQRWAGLLVEKEVRALGRLVEAPARRFVAVLAGGRLTDQVGLLSRLVDRVDALVLGGALAHTFLAASGTAVGASPIEANRVASARTILDGAARKQVEVLLPIDHVVASAEDAADQIEIVDRAAIPAGRIGLDIGPRSRERLVNALADAQTIFWHGPLGAAERASFASGTRAAADAIATACRRGAFAAACGDATASAVEQAGLTSAISHVSTGGSAALEFVAGQPLPGLTVLAN